MERSRNARNSTTLRVAIVDGHDVFRGACAALLRTEGVDVAETATGGDLIGFTRGFAPDVVLIDVTPGPWLPEAVRQLRRLDRAPAIVLTSSGSADRLQPCLTELPFLAKADICTAAILTAAAAGSEE
jgi:CheY-like chemotaxis protein